MRIRGLKLLDELTAVRLLGSTALARLAYNSKDGTPQVIADAVRVDRATRSSLAPTPDQRNCAACGPNPDVAITIDTPGPPPEVLLLQGRAELGPAGGIVDEYAAAHRRYYGAHFWPFARAFGLLVFRWLSVSLVGVAIIGAIPTLAANSAAVAGWTGVVAGFVLLLLSAAGPRLTQGSPAAP